MLQRARLPLQETFLTIDNPAACLQALETRICFDKHHPLARRGKGRNGRDSLTKESCLHSRASSESFYFAQAPAV